MRNLLKIFTNSITDPGVLFSAGNTVAVYQTSRAAALTNAGMGAACLTVRLATEFNKQNIHFPLPKALQNLADNPGAALATSGIFNLAASGFAALNIDPSKPETILPAAIVGAFGVGNLSRGIASGLKTGALSQRFLDAGGICAANAGLFMASPDAHWAVKSMYIATALMAMHLSKRNEKPHGLMQPDLANAGVIMANGASNTNPVFIIANMIWSTAYVGLDCLKKSGGVIEAFAPKHQAASAAGPRSLP